MMKKDATKRRGSIAAHALIKTRNFINVMGFPGLIQKQGLSLCNINIVWSKYSVDSCICLPLTLYFTC